MSHLKLGLLLASLLLASLLLPSCYKTERELDLILPGQLPEGTAQVTLEFTQDGKLYGSHGEQKMILAEKIVPGNTQKTKAWLEKMQAENEDLRVSFIIPPDLPQAVVIEHLNLLATLEISQVTFTDTF